MAHKIIKISSFTQERREGETKFNQLDLKKAEQLVFNIEVNMHVLSNPKLYFTFHHSSTESGFRSQIVVPRNSKSSWSEAVSTVTVTVLIIQ